MAALCKAESCIATPSGLSAIAGVIASHARVGGHILVQESVYGPTQALCDKVLESLQCRFDAFDTPEVLEAKLTPETSLVFIEVPSSLTMRMIDVAAVCAIANALIHIPVSA